MRVNMVGKWPSIAKVQYELEDIQRYCGHEEPDVRLNVQESGAWCVLWGDPSYDTDHRGFWGASTLDQDTDCKELARDLLDQAKEDFAMKR